jgi:hypothetical protein
MAFEPEYPCFVLVDYHGHPRRAVKRHSFGAFRTAKSRFGDNSFALPLAVNQLVNGLMDGLLMLGVRWL